MTVSSSPHNHSNSVIVRLRLFNEVGVLNRVTQKISDLGGNIGAIDIVRPEPDALIRDITIFTHNPEHGEKLVEGLREIEDVEFINFSDRTFLAHLQGKIEINNRLPLSTRDDLSIAYTPGVARVCTEIHKNPENAYKLTIKGNTVAVVTDGTAVLGLGDIGPKAAMPVMEGKAMLFKQFVPVFHDDQHGTAVVTTAALINALKLVRKKPKDIKVVVSGAGAAGTACSKMIMHLGVKNLIGCDSKGAIHNQRTDINQSKRWFADNANPDQEQGSLKEVLKGADVFVGVSAPNILDAGDIRNMEKDAIVFAMANPDPEILPEDARPVAAVVATGRSDYPNQINNVLCFPGIFRGALDCRAKTITEEMKLPDYIIPTVFDKSVTPKIAAAIAECHANET